jgi:hypothetical protein
MGRPGPVLTFARTDSEPRRASELSDWTKLTTAENPIEAGFLRGLLEADGIEVQLRSMELWTAAVEIYYSEGARPSLWVHERNLEAARRVLQRRDETTGEAAWTCPACGERLEGQFTACWHCATEHEATE